MGRIRVALVIAVFASLIIPARAAAFDGPLTPVSPAPVSKYAGGDLPLPANVRQEQPTGARALDLPTAADLTPYAVPVLDQGSVNSCAAWSTVYAAMGYWLNKQNIPGGPLAPMYTYSQVTGGQNIASSSAEHLQIAFTQGVDSTAHYQPQGDFNYWQLPTAAQSANAGLWRLSDYGQITGVTQGNAGNRALISAKLAEGNPVVISLPIFSDFGTSSYRGSLYDVPAGGFTGGWHAVAALGYDASGLKIQNSWGRSWGVGGYTTLSWYFVNTYVRSALSVGPLVAAEQPRPVADPEIAGFTRLGSTFTATYPGQWSARPTSYAHQWLRDGEEIPGATGSSYTSTANDVGHSIRLRVRAYNAYGSNPAYSRSIGPIVPDVPANTAPPTLSGTPTRGQTLTASTGSFTNSPTSYRFEWTRNGSVIAGVSGSTYTLQAADVGARIRVTVIATNPGGSGWADSNTLGPVAGIVPVNTAAPSISGTPTRGATLTANRGTWADADSYAYQWQRNGVDINYETGSTYVLQTADVGASIGVRVSGFNADGTSASAPSGAVGPVTITPPANTAAPTVSGTPKRATWLTAAAGTWTGANLVHTYQWQRNGVDIAGATNSNYWTQSADVGATLRVRVTATNGDGATSAYSAGVGPIAPTPPAVAQAPSILGTPARGERLNALGGTWSNADTFTYQWQRDNADIAGATQAVYTLQTADAGAQVRVRVTATNVDGSTPAYSAAVGPVTVTPPANTAVPTITGTPKRGVMLIAAQGGWTGATAVAYQWQREAVDIAGATGSTYTPVGADVGAKLRVKVTATNLDGSVAAVSAATTAVQAAPPVSTSAPLVSGSAAVGSRLTGTSGAWSPAPDTYAYQWQRNGTDIAGATTRSYTAVAADAGALLRLRVTATNVDGTVTAYSITVGPVAGPPQSVVAPVITGTLTDAQTLSVTAGTWSSDSGLSHTIDYQWLRDGAEISGATSALYRTSAADVGARLGVRVTATDSNGASADVTVTTTGPIAGRALTLLRAPAITGTAKVDGPLNADEGEWSVPTTSLTFQWRRCTSACVDIAGARSRGYTPTTADVGATLVVRVQATSPGHTATADSRPSEAVTALPAPTPPAPEPVRSRVPVAMQPPGLTGQTMTGMYLSANRGIWDAPEDTTYTYQWQRTGVVVPGATAPTYLLGAADVGRQLQVVVTATSAAGSATAGSPLSPIVGGGAPIVLPPTPPIAPVPPVTPGLPILTGSDTVGGTVDLNVSGTFWRCTRGCVAVANGRSYTLTAADAGATIRASADGVYADQTRGPITSPASGSAAVSTGATALRTAAGTLVAKARVEVKRGVATVTVTPKAKGYRAWACPTGEDWKPCSAPVKLGAKPAKLRVKVAKGERVRVVVAK